MTESFYWTEYTVVLRETMEELEKAMREYLNLGFEPIGGLVISKKGFYREVAKKSYTEK